MFARVGIDLVDVDEVRSALAAHGERYVRRVYTDREQAVAAGRPERLACLFAAKEATLKALAIGTDAATVWRDVEIDSGRVRLHGSLAGRHPNAPMTISHAGRGTHALAVALLPAEAAR